MSADVEVVNLGSRGIYLSFNSDTRRVQIDYRTDTARAQISLGSSAVVSAFRWPVYLSVFHYYRANKDGTGADEDETTNPKGLGEPSPANDNWTRVYSPTAIPTSGRTNGLYLIQYGSARPITPAATFIRMGDRASQTVRHGLLPYEEFVQLDLDGPGDMMYGCDVKLREILESANPVFQLRVPNGIFASRGGAAGFDDTSTNEDIPPSVGGLTTGSADDLPANDGVPGHTVIRADLTSNWSPERDSYEISRAGLQFRRVYPDG